MRPGDYISTDGATYSWTKLTDISTGQAMFNHVRGGVSVCILKEDWPSARQALDEFIEFDNALEGHKKELLEEWRQKHV